MAKWSDDEAKLETGMSTDTSKPPEHCDGADLQATARAIEDAIAHSRAHNHHFLTYLLEMASLETTNLISARARAGKSLPSDKR